MLVNARRRNWNRRHIYSGEPKRVAFRLAQLPVSQLNIQRYAPASKKTFDSRNRWFSWRNAIPSRCDTAPDRLRPDRPPVFPTQSLGVYLINLARSLIANQSLRKRLTNPANAKLIPRLQQVTAAPIDFQHFFALHGRAGLVRQSRNNPSRGDLKDVSG